MLKSMSFPNAYKVLLVHARMNWGTAQCKVFQVKLISCQQFSAYRKQFERKLGQKGKRRAILVRTDREMVWWMDGYVSCVCWSVNPNGSSYTCSWNTTPVAHRCGRHITRANGKVRACVSLLNTAMCFIAHWYMHKPKPPAGVILINPEHFLWHERV